jgi:hypothetical protein
MTNEQIRVASLRPLLIPSSNATDAEVLAFGAARMCARAGALMREGCYVGAKDDLERAFADIGRALGLDMCAVVGTLETRAPHA